MPEAISGPTRLLTHQRTEGDDGQESLDQDAEPVRQSSVVTAVRARLVDVGHVGDFKNANVQKSFVQKDPAVAVHVHTDTIKTRDSGERQKEHFLRRATTPAFFTPGTLKRQISTSANRLLYVLVNISVPAATSHNAKTEKGRLCRLTSMFATRKYINNKTFTEILLPVH